LGWWAWSGWDSDGWVEGSLEEVLESLGFLVGSIVVGVLSGVVIAKLGVVLRVDIVDVGDSLLKNWLINSGGESIRPLSFHVGIEDSFTN
jgi:hypothetical protein